MGHFSAECASRIQLQRIADDELIRPGENAPALPRCGLREPRRAITPNYQTTATDSNV